MKFDEYLEKAKQSEAYREGSEGFSQKVLGGLDDLLRHVWLFAQAQRGPSQEEVYALAQSKGWYDMQELVERKLLDSGATAGALSHVRNTWVSARLALIASEVSEALELVRKGEVGGNAWALELADISIRVKDLAQSTGVDLCQAERTKHEINKGRPVMHGGKKL